MRCSVAVAVVAVSVLLVVLNVMTALGTLPQVMRPAAKHRNATTVRAAEEERAEDRGERNLRSIYSRLAGDTATKPNTVTDRLASSIATAERAAARLEVAAREAERAVAAALVARDDVA